MRILIILACFSSVLLAQEHDADTAKTYLMKDVVITATRSHISVPDSPSPIEVVDGDEFIKFNGGTVADILRCTQSVVLNDYGANAALKTISLRGTSASHLLVLINGIRYNSFQNGLVDFSMLTLNDVERIEIVRGGSSALYGTDALGGVVNILTRKPSKRLNTLTEISAGSFGFQKYRIEASGTIGTIGLLGGYSDERGRDNYPFVVPRPAKSDTTVNRLNNDFYRKQAHFHSTIPFDEYSDVSIITQKVQVHRGVPGPFFGIGMVGEARQDDDDVNFLANFTDRRLEGIVVELKTGFHYGLQRYFDPNIFYPIDSYYKNRLLSLSPQATMLLGTNDQLIFGAEFVQGLLNSNDFDSDIIRVQKSAYISHVSQFDFQRELFDRIVFFQAARYDNISDVGYALTPKVGVNVRLSRLGEVHFRSTVGQNFRSPTFNDMYYRGFSNPNLKPERSTSFDVGFTSEIRKFGRTSSEITYFHIDTENRILFDPNLFIPVNIGRAETNGLEVKCDGNFWGDVLNLKANYSFTDARKKNSTTLPDSTLNKQLMFVPKHLFNVLLSVHLVPITFSISHSVVGSRYISEDNTTSLPPYRLTNANVVFRMFVAGWNFYTKVEMNNIFNENYEVFPNYPMPRSSYRLTLGVEY